jgi:hypothetical protein
VSFAALVGQGSVCFSHCAHSTSFSFSMITQFVGMLVSLNIYVVGALLRVHLLRISLSLSFSLASYWILERWWVAAGFSSLKSFITSWPNRAPGWILILFLSIFTLVWYLDLWQNHSGESGEESSRVEQVFNSVPEGQWQWLIIIATFTVVPAVVFVLIELFRETKADGSNEEKGQVENILEGFFLLILVMAWIPTTMVATTPGGAASLIGNAYFFTWLLVIFILEAFVWFVHDQRKGLHLALKEKANEYHEKQREVLHTTRDLQRRQEFENDDFDDTEREYEQDVIESA